MINYNKCVYLCLLISPMVSCHSELVELELNTTKESNNITDGADEKDLLTWMAPLHIREQFPYYVSGVDYENRPVVVLEWGKWNPQKIVEKNGEDLKILYKYADQVIARLKYSYFKTEINDPDVKDDVAMIVDFDGLDLDQVRSVSNVKFYIGLSERVEKVFYQFEYGLLVNANPLVKQLLQVIKPFMSNFLERSEIYGTNSKIYIPKILRKIPRDQLHPAYGGLKSFLPVAVYG